MHRPTKSDLQAAVGRKFPTSSRGPRRAVLRHQPRPLLGRHGLALRSARQPVLGGPHLAGFTDRVLDPGEERLPAAGLGITNLVPRATRRRRNCRIEELADGRRALERKVRRYAPRWLAVLGIGAYRIGFGRRRAGIGEQPERLESTRLWVLPNPSGLNANYQLPDLIRLFAELRAAARSP